MLTKGQGPEEFVFPRLVVLPEDNVYIYDILTGKTALASVKKAISGENPIVTIENKPLENITYMMLTERDGKIYFSPSYEQPFRVEKDDNTQYRFGKNPIDQKVENSHEIFQGRTVYNPYRQEIVYTTLHFPYFAVYKREENTFTLKTELLNTKEYEIINNKFKYDSHIRGSNCTTLTSDYIVTVERDQKYDQTDGLKTGRDFSKSSRTIFLYDYDLKLKKILNLDKPILWIAGEPTNNTIYALVADPDFMILKYEL